MDTRPIRPARRPHWHRPRPAIRRWSIDPVIRSEDYRTYRCYVCRQRLDGREINEPYPSLVVTSWGPARLDLSNR